MKLESQKEIIDKPQSYLFEALSKVENYERLMPDSIAKFEILSSDSFVFGLKGMPEIKLVIKETTPDSSVILGAASDKIPFTLKAVIEAAGNDKSEVQLLFEGSFNPMMAMMVKGPISKFIETLAGNMSRL